jgi:hypothetical protein
MSSDTLATRCIVLRWQSENADRNHLNPSQRALGAAIYAKFSVGTNQFNKGVAANKGRRPKPRPL